MRRRRPRREALAVLAAGCLVVLASGTGATYAAFSDFAVAPDHRVGASRVALGTPGAGGAELSFPGLLPGTEQRGSVAVAYTGQVPADLALELRAGGGSAFCEATGGGWSPQPGGAVQIAFGGAWYDYCGLLGSSLSLPLRSDAEPGTALSVPVSVRLAPGTDFRYSELAGADRLVVTAQQSSAPGAGFSDFAIRSISIGVGRIAPPVPAACRVTGGGWTVLHGTEGDDVIAAGNGKSIVLGLGGDDTITGGNGKDCLVGGDGDDVLTGSNGPDVLLGGAGTDTCTGGRAGDVHDCELPVPEAEARSGAGAGAGEPSVEDPVGSDPHEPEPDEPVADEPEPVEEPSEPPVPPATEEPTPGSS